MSKPVYLYVAAQAEGWPVKVGISANPDSRLKSIQTGNPSIVDLAFVSEPMTRSLARKIEAEIHHFLEEYGMVGEWFGISVHDAVVTAQTVIRWAHK